MPEVVFVEEVNVLEMRHDVFCQPVAKAFDLQGAGATSRWDKIAALLTHSDEELAWCRRPLGLD